MASIRKREWISPKGERKTSWQLDYRDQFGKRHQPQFERKKDAEAERRRIGEEVHKGTHTADRATWTVSQACEEYINYIDRQHQLYGKPSGYMVKSYGGAARRHIIPQFTQLKLNTPRIWLPLQKFLDDIAAADKASPHGEVKHDKLAVIKIVLNQTIKFAIERGKLNANPLRDHWLTLPERRKPRVEIPTKEEAHRFAAALQSRPKGMHEITYRNAVVIMNLACYTPMREGEICALWWENIDWDNNEINTTHNITMQRTEAGITWVRGDTKTAAGERKAPMLPQLRELLLEHAASRRCELTGYILVDTDGQSLTPQAVATVHWPSIATAAGLLGLSRRADGTLYQGRKPKYHFHALRHFGAALLIEQNINPYHLMQIMGHADIKVTLNTYGHLFPTDTSIRDKMVAGLNGFQLPQLPDRTSTVSLTERDKDGRAKVAELRAKGMKRNKIAATLEVPGWQVSRWDVRGAGAERLVDRDQRILKLRREGKPIAAIALVEDMSLAGVQDRLEAHGDPVKEHDASIAELRAKNKTVAEIATILGLSPALVKGRLASFGRWGKPAAEPLDVTQM